MFFEGVCLGLCHPDPWRVGKGGPEPHLLTLLWLDPRDPQDLRDPGDLGINSQPMSSFGASSKDRLWDLPGRSKPFKKALKIYSLGPTIKKHKQIKVWDSMGPKSLLGPNRWRPWHALATGLGKSGVQFRNKR